MFTNSIGQDVYLYEEEGAWLRLALRRCVGWWYMDAATTGQKTILRWNEKEESAG